MNNNGQQPRKSSTNTRSLSNRIDRLNQEVKPTLTLSRAPSNPRPLVQPKSQFIHRKVRVYLNIPTSTPTATCTFGQIATAFGVVGTDNIDLKVLAFTVWNATGLAGNTNFLRVNGLSGLVSDMGDSTFEDLGAGNSLPAVKLNIPDPLSKITTVGASSSAAALTVNCSPTSTNPGAAQTIVCDFFVAVRAGA